MIYDVFMEPYDLEQQVGLNELLEVPLGLHPEQTEVAKARRAEAFRQAMNDQM